MSVSPSRGCSRCSRAGGRKASSVPDRCVEHLALRRQAQGRSGGSIGVRSPSMPDAKSLYINVMALSWARMARPLVCHADSPACRFDLLQRRPAVLPANAPLQDSRFVRPLEKSAAAVHGPPGPIQPANHALHPSGRRRPLGVRRLQYRRRSLASARARPCDRSGGRPAGRWLRAQQLFAVRQRHPWGDERGLAPGPDRPRAVATHPRGQAGNRHPPAARAQPAA